MDLSMQIVKHVLVDQDKDIIRMNFLFSPLSLTIALSMRKIDCIIYWNSRVQTRQYLT